MHEQGSIEWLVERLGHVTASRFADVLGSVVARARYYTDLQAELAAINGDYKREYVKKNSFTAPALRTGIRHEPMARIAYELLEDLDVPEVGFHEASWNGHVGASVDGLVGTDGVLEIKCPHTEREHLWTIANGMPPKHLPQVHGGVAVYDREWCDFVSFYPDCVERPMVIQRIHYDKAYIRKLITEVSEFANHVISGSPLPETIERNGTPNLF